MCYGVQCATRDLAQPFIHGPRPIANGLLGKLLECSFINRALGLPHEICMCRQDVRQMITEVIHCEDPVSNKARGNIGSVMFVLEKGTVPYG